MIMSFESIPSSLLFFGSDVIAKMTVLILVVIFVDRVTRSRSAAFRHRLWAFTFVAIACLPWLPTSCRGFLLRLFLQVGSNHRPHRSQSLPSRRTRGLLLLLKPVRCSNRPLGDRRLLLKVVYRLHFFVLKPGRWLHCLTRTTKSLSSLPH